MRSFENDYLRRLPITHTLLSSVRLLGEFRGKQELFKQQSPQALERLRQAAVIQSTESSNRIEGVVAPAPRIKALVAEKTEPRDRPEQEIAGYRDVLNLIHTRHADMPFTPSVVLQLHRDLFRYTPQEGGRWKPGNNLITETHPDGARVVRFEPVAAHLTPIFMEDLHSLFQAYWQEGLVDRLLLIAAYVLDFLCIHPFPDGNGRMARLLTLLLLYQAGYEVGRFISLERIVEDTREGYYDSLQRSSAGWHEGEHDLLPWTEYFLGISLAAYREFEERAGNLPSARGAKTGMVLDAVRDLPATFRMADVERQCPTVTRDMIRVVLRGLKKRGLLTSEGAGPGAAWRKAGEVTDWLDARIEDAGNSGNNP
jgi:Fic family protein